MQIANSGPGTIALPNGVELPRGATVFVADDAWKVMAEHTVVAQWVADGDVTATADPKPAKAPAKAPTGTGNTGNTGNTGGSVNPLS